MKVWRPSTDPGDERAEDLAVALLRAITRPEVRDGGLPAALEALALAVGGTAVVVQLAAPPRTLLWEDGELRDLELPVPPTGREAEVVLAHGGGPIGTLRILGLRQVAVIHQAIAYIGADLGWLVANHVDHPVDEVHALKVEADRLRQIVRSLPDGAVLVSAAGRVIGWNQAMEQLTGVDADAALLQPWSGLLDLRDDVDQPLRQMPIGYSTAQKGHLVDFWEVLRLHPRGGGKPRWIEFAFGPTGDPSSGHGVAMVVRDVTARLDMQRTKDAFLATASHELRSPLTPLHAVLELLDRAHELPPSSAMRMREAAARQIERLERLTDDIVTMVDLDRSLSAGRLEHFDPRVTAQTVLQAAGQDAQRRVELRVTRAVEVHSSPALVARILDILLDNALRHTRGPIVVRIEERGDAVVIDVEDSGTGIPVEARERLLTPVGGEIGAGAVGLGLGLRIARTLANRLGGELELDDSPTGGTRARLRLPHE